MFNLKCVTSFLLGEDEAQLFSRNLSLPPASTSPLVKKRKKMDLMELMEEEAHELLAHFNHQNMDALLRLTRHTLEVLRKHVHDSSNQHFNGGSALCLNSRLKKYTAKLDFNLIITLDLGYKLALERQKSSR